MFKCGIFACEEVHADKYNTVGFKYMEIATCNLRFLVFLYEALFLTNIPI